MTIWSNAIKRSIGKQKRKEDRVSAVYAEFPKYDEPRFDFPYIIDHLGLLKDYQK